MLIAEELLLLATDDETGKTTVSSANLDPALGGALLIDLVLAGRVGLQGEGRQARITVADGLTEMDPLLEAGLEKLAEKGPLKTEAAVRRLAKGLRDSLHESLERRGIVRRERGRVLGIFPTTRWPEADSHLEAQVRGEVSAALMLGQEPGPYVGGLIAVLAAADMLKTVVDKADLKPAKERAKEIAQGNWASEGVRKVIQATHAATIAAVVASTSAATASTS